MKKIKYIYIGILMKGKSFSNFYLFKQIVTLVVFLELKK